MADGSRTGGILSGRRQNLQEIQQDVQQGDLPDPTELTS